MSIEPPKANTSCFNDLKRDERMGFFPKEVSSALSQRILKLALDKIVANCTGMIFDHFVAVSPSIILDTLPKNLNLPILKKRKNSKRIEKEDLPEYYLKNLKNREEKYRIPIGINPTYFCNWLNSFLQFIIFIPSLRTLFDYTPKSYSAFNNFIDMYLSDQEEKKLVTGASGAEVFELISSKYNLKTNDLLEILNSILMSVVPLSQIILKNSFFGKFLIAQNEWRLSFSEESVSLEQGLEFLIREGISLPLEILIDCKRTGKKKDGRVPFKYSTHLFLFDNFNFQNYYELDSFLECRPDVDSDSYFAYLKVEGLWYQCDDSIVKPVSASSLPLALSKGVMFHYKKVKNEDRKKKLT